MKTELNLMYGTTGVYQTNYSNMLITVRLLEAVELAGSGTGYSSPWVALTTYKCMKTGTISRVEHDILEAAKVEHCKAYAVQQDPTYGELYKAHMAHAYWRTIQ